MRAGRGGKGDCLLAAKGNQEHLYEDAQATLAPLLGGEIIPTEAEYARTEKTSRGRDEKRICHVSTKLDHIRNQSPWKNLAAAGVVISERVVNGKLETEMRYFISSRVLTAQEFLKTARDHWLVENQLHWVMDVVFGEDGHQLRKGSGPENFTILRKLAHAMIKLGNPKHGIKGTREMAGWNTDYLEKLICQVMESLGKCSA